MYSYIINLNFVGFLFILREIYKIYKGLINKKILFNKLL